MEGSRVHIANWRTHIRVALPLASEGDNILIVNGVNLVIIETKNF